MLKRRWTADVSEVVEVSDGRYPSTACGEVAYAPAGDAECLRQARDGNGAIGHSGQRCDADVTVAVEEEVLVDLIGNDEDVVLDRDVGNDLKLSGAEDFSRWVGWGVDDDGASARVDAFAKHVEIELPVGRGERDDDRLHAEREESVDVIAVEGLKDDDFVAGIEECEASGVQSSRCAGGDQDLRVRIGGNAVMALQLCGNGSAQSCDAVEAGIYIVTATYSFDRLSRDGWRQVSVADSLCEVDATNAVALDGHGTNLGLD